MPLSSPPPSWSSIKNKPSTVAGFGITDMSSQSVASAANGGVNSVNGVGGAVSLSALAAYAASVGTNGYQKLPSGLIIQWGNQSCPVTSNTVFSFPISFPNACINSTLTFFNGTNYTSNISVASVSSTQMNIRNNNGGATASINWLAIGY